MVGIVSYGAYIPRMRLNRMAVMKSMGWFAPHLIGQAKGERAMCNWDEDTMTMSVSAGQDCLLGMDKGKIDAVYMASTTFPFSDRQNAGVLKAALNLNDEISSGDFSSSLRSGTTAVISAIDAVKGGEKSNVLVTASDQRRAKSASTQEMYFGDGAGSLLIGKENVIEVMPVTAGEDFSRYGRTAEKVPIAMFWLGTVEPEAYQDHLENGPSLPGLHNPQYYPSFDLSYTTGVRALSRAVLDLFTAQ